MLRPWSSSTLYKSFAALLALAAAASAAAGQQVQLVDVIPAQYSSEARSDSEPNVSVNPANPSQVVVSAFTPCPPMISTTNAPIYYSTDGGATWQLNCIVPGNSPSTGTGDITLRFAGSTGVLYAGTLRGGAGLDLNILRTGDFTNPAPMTLLVNRTNEDQPYTQALTAGTDHVYIGNNNLAQSIFSGGVGGKTASVDLSQDAATAPVPANFGTDLLEVRSTCGQDLPNVRPAIHPDGTIYAAYFRNEPGSSCFSGTNTVDVVVARDDNWASGATPFTALVDPGDGQPGKLVATGQVIVWLANLGTNRIGGQLSIAVDPGDSRKVYLSWAEGATAAAYTLHVRSSADGGATWSGDLETVTPATNPALAVNKQGMVGFLYQKLVNPGTCHSGGAAGACWETHFETYDGATWTDLAPPLANTPDNAGSFPLGDYEHLLAVGEDFYGAFSAANYPDTANFYPGVLYQRYADWGAHQLYADVAHTSSVTPSVDPFFFHITELPPAQSFYVRDWTDTPVSHDNGEEPSTNPNWWTTGDVWNRLSNTAGGFNANDQPNHQDAQDAISGHNFAFVRVHRKAAAAAGAPSVNVTARFLYADYGLGVPYQDVSASSQATLAFAAADTVQTLADGAGVQWDLPATRSTHICMAVEISAPGDPYNPELAGRAPGWPTTDWTLPADKNKAQRNMDLPPMAMGGGMMSAFAILHNAATFPRTMTVHYQVPPAVLRRLEGAQIGWVGGETQPLRSEGVLNLPGMQPGENRWLNISLSAPNAALGETIPVALEELVGGAAVNGVTASARVAPLDEVIRENLKAHRAVFARLATAFGIERAREESRAAADLLAKPSVSVSDYLGLLAQHIPAVEAVLGDLDRARHTADALGAVQTLKQLAASVAANAGALSANNHATLLNQLDAVQTMLQKGEGDPADILQMVLWQKELYTTVPQLHRLEVARFVIDESDEFIKAYGKPAAKEDSYPQLIRELRKAFHVTAEALERSEVRVERELDQMEDNLRSLPALEKAHRAYLLELQGLVR